MSINDLLLEMETYAKENYIPILNKESSLYINNFIKEHNIKSILEIGSAIGYSSINFASLNTKVTTIEKDIERYTKALSYIDKSNLSNNITIINNDALEVNLNESYDLIFIDASKGKNKAFLNKFKSNLNINGYIIIDNMFFHGLVGKSSTILNRRKRTLIKKIEDFITYLSNQNEFKITIINVGDGLYLLERNTNE